MDLSLLGDRGSHDSSLSQNLQIEIEHFLSDLPKK